MKPHNPYRLLILGSLVIATGSSFILLIFRFFVSYHIHWIYILLTFISSYLFSYYAFSFILQRYIYDKIKLIYKTIHTLKVPEGTKDKKVDLRKEILQQVNEDVVSWAEDHKRELDDLKKLEVYRREFLGNVSHELKTPIFNIQGYILTLLDGALNDPEVNKDYLEKSEKNIDRMINIVQDLEIISQLESGEIKLNFVPFEITALVREIFEMLEIKAQKRNIALKFHDTISDETRIYVEADKDKIRQVLINLIENSIKYGNENGRTKVSFYDMDENVLVEVSDNGIGIDARHLPRLFERFYRVDKSRSRNQGGSGLGLAIVKHIIESHKQTVNVRSAPNVGSTFSFTLKKSIK